MFTNELSGALKKSFFPVDLPCSLPPAYAVSLVLAVAVAVRYLPLADVL